MQRGPGGHTAKIINFNEPKTASESGPKRIMVPEHSVNYLIIWAGVIFGKSIHRAPGDPAKVIGCCEGN